MYKLHKGEASEYYQRELFVLSLKHPNLMQMISYREKQETYDGINNYQASYIITKFEKFTLVDLVELFSKKTDEKLARYYFKEIVTVVEFLHSKGISNLNLSPENIYGGVDFSLKLANFQYVYHQGDGKIQMQGCKNYRPPELDNGRCKNPYQVDVYCLGILLFVMMIGHLPYNEN